MVEIYRTDQQVLSTLDDIQEGCWINMVDPTNKEIEQIAKRFEIEPEDIASALDEEESSRIELQDGYTLILVDIPSIEIHKYLTFLYLRNNVLNHNHLHQTYIF